VWRVNVKAYKRPEKLNIAVFYTAFKSAGWFRQGSVRTSWLEKNWARDRFSSYG